MKVYVATKFENQDTFHQLAAMLKKLGHTITRDWTKESLVSNPDGGQQFSQEDYAGVVDAEVLIMIPTKAHMAGAFTELGIALGKGLDVIIVDGFNPDYQTNIFYHLPFPWVRHAKSIWEACKMVDDMDFEGRQAFVKYLDEEKSKTQTAPVLQG